MQKHKSDVFRRLLSLFLVVALAIPLATNGVVSVFAVDTTSSGGSITTSGTTASSANGDWKCLSGGYGYRIYPVKARTRAEIESGGDYTLPYEYYMPYRELALYELDSFAKANYSNYYTVSFSGATSSTVGEMCLNGGSKGMFSQILPSGVKLPEQVFANGKYVYNQWDELLNGDEYETGVVHTSKNF